MGRTGGLLQDNDNNIVPYIEFEVRTVGFSSGSNINQGNTIRIYRDDVWKTFSIDGKGVISNSGAGTLVNGKIEHQIF